MDFKIVNSLIGRWGGTLKFFPSDPDARIGIAEQIAAMASDEEQVRWLVGRIPQLYSEWPGILEVRAVYCTKFKPRDGVESALGTGSPAFAALCPEDEERKALESAPRARQITGQVSKASADSEMASLVERIARHSNPLSGVKPATEAEIEAIKKAQDASRKESAPLAEERA